ncbi:protein Wnt-2 isoform X2 [Drosophila busckii]|nr:protein Wnt-2 isoform X2 [Drosophila busckii]
MTTAQRQLCSEMPDALIALGEGHQLGAQECQHQFRGHRWNCSEVWQRNAFAHVIPIASREAAYTYAIASAGAAYAVTAACAKGNISVCGCDMQHKTGQGQAKAENWKWGGCSADVEFGMKYSRKFMDARELERDSRSFMNLHNNRVGRTLVKKLLRTDCKCHGVSGSCVMKTCWKSLPPFRLLGDKLMQKYQKAKTVQAIKGKRGLRLVLSRRKHSRAAAAAAAAAAAGQKPAIVAPKRLELIYLEASPNYCERSIQTGTLGTAGRPCNRTGHGPQSCDLLCCGRGHNTQHIRRTSQCRCQFRWCCEVKCDQCDESYEEFTCK